MLAHDLAPTLKWDRHTTNNKVSILGNIQEKHCGWWGIISHIVLSQRRAGGSWPQLCPSADAISKKIVPEHLTVYVCCSRWAVCSSTCKLLHLWDLGGKFDLQIQEVSVPKRNGPQTTGTQGFCFWVDNPTCRRTKIHPIGGRSALCPWRGQLYMAHPHVWYFPLISHGPTSLSLNWQEEPFSCLVCFTLWRSRTSRRFQEAELKRLTSGSYQKHHSPV